MHSSKQSRTNEGQPGNRELHRNRCEQRMTEVLDGDGILSSMMRGEGAGKKGAWSQSGPPQTSSARKDSGYQWLLPLGPGLPIGSSLRRYLKL